MLAPHPTHPMQTDSTSPNAPNAPRHADSYWAASAGDEVDAPALRGVRETDAVIVGGGFTGLRAALRLAEAGASVLLLEAARIGWGASGRNGGQANPLPPMNTPADLERRFGAARAERIARTMLDSADELFDLIARYSLDCDARRNGWLRVAHCSGAAATMRQHCEQWRAAGADIEFCDGDELARRLGSGRFKIGALMRAAGCIHPLRYARALARCAADSGATLCAQSPALNLRRARERWEIETPAGRVRARQVLLCTNGYTDRLLPGLATSILPLTSVQMATQPLPSDIAAEILPAGHTFADTRRTIFYGRLEPNRRFILGSLGRFGGDGVPADFRRLRREAARLFPGLRAARWDYRWGGRIALTADRVPHLHEPAPGVLAGLGYSGRGVALANVMGRILADRALGQAADETPFPTAPIQNHPPTRLRSHAVPLAMGWMRLRDRMEIK
ncbi:MAG: NAD(P)/FAD-dependent oxidoreductase [bacterium]